MALDTTALTETSAFTANVYPPLSNTTVQAADVAAGEQAFANRTKYLNDTKADRAGDTFTGPVVFDGTVETNGALQVDGAATVNGAAEFNSTVQLDGTTTFAAAIIPSGGNAVYGKRHVDVGALTANANIDGLSEYYAFGAPTGDVDVTITHASGGPAREIRCYSTVNSPGARINFYQSAVAGKLGDLPPAGDHSWIVFVYTGLSWEVAAYGGGANVT